MKYLVFHTSHINSEGDFSDKIIIFATLHCCVVDPVSTSMPPLLKDSSRRLSHRQILRHRV